MVARNYCCCAIPIFNVGIYFTLAEQFALGILVGTLSIATTSLVSAATPSFAPWIVAVVAYLFSGVQLLGFLGVFKEKATLYSRYSLINSILVFAGLAMTATFIIISAAQHPAATSKCVKTFFTTDAATTGKTGAIGSDSEGKVVCEIFTWVGVGLMGGLWVIMAILQSYLILVIRNYGQSQRDDHKRYYALHSGTNDNIAGHDAYAMTDRSGQAGGYTDRPPQHQQQSSMGSVIGEKPFGNDAMYGYAPSQPRQGQAAVYREQSTDDAYLQHPSAAFTEEPGPTPKGPSYYTTSTAPSYTSEPPRVQYHPAEGSFGRKTPRDGTGQGSMDTFDQNFFPRR